MDSKEMTIDELKSLLGESIKESEVGKAVEALQADIKELKTSKVANTAEERAEVSAKFIRSVLNGDAELKTVTTDVASMGYTVPTELANAVHEKKDKISKIRKYAFVFQMDGPFDLPTEGTGVTAYWITTEADTDLTESNPTVSKKSLDDHYLASRVRVPYKLLKTSGVNLENYVSKLSARALVKQEETAFVGGNGSGQPTGFRQLSITPVYQVGSSFAYTDLINLYFAMPEQYRENAVFITSTAGLKKIMNLRDADNKPVFDVTQKTILGKPYLEVTDIPENLGTSANETELWFADLSEYWIKDGQTMLSERRAVEGRLQVDLYLYQSTDGVVVNSDAFKYITGMK